ncbi:unnamed protein product [Parascedosporium putredinis]|uniref:Uncharacterized protein n=1 Tax=Parascedosporium putredinis TaxID=1442378 RepID=A0A9P1HBN0_9PEZI|nr:unnamed protein product [Parascedosporium putredinis]CAI8002962.1 unnamed protein product [Parascedosporium putredinis]
MPEDEIHAVARKSLLLEVASRRAGAKACIHSLGTHRCLEDEVTGVRSVSSAAQEGTCKGVGDENKNEPLTKTTARDILAPRL